MPTSRSYGDACGIARALDVVGERWALLVVRELLLGPQRFTELRQALAGASSNLLADRLRELEARDVLRRRKLPPPASSWVYELTEHGRELEPIVLALGAWGVRVPLPPPPTTLSATSVMLFLRAAAHPDPAAPATTCRIELDDRVWTVHTAAGQLQVEPGEPTSADARLRTDPKTLNALLNDPTTLDTAISDGSAVATGDLSALRSLLHAPTRSHQGRARPPHLDIGWSWKSPDNR
ncbi:HxlR family transcriptional regulator [Acrocarpospora corrugata]|uniref:HxlR family transcriptional regulator n=1 Tax=Acrocarpospora corrugata TaxID=35763 RepID=A0A5M3W120_9ACTN|nr:winged helix-turn-helix transcriptional regulator [Acrocarpospora corrugata]GES00811.1 HxlR family transcriptional regulator [Acrocarpospora corrugata]